MPFRSVRRTGCLAVTLALMVSGGLLWAKAPETSLRPQTRPAVVAVLGELSATSAGLARVTQRAGQAAPAAVARQITPNMRAALPPVVSLRPNARPAGLANRARSSARITPAASQKRSIRRGTVCNNRHIQGEVVGYVPGRLSACGIKDAVRVTSVRGIPLSNPALMNCRTAKAVDRWVDRGLIPSVGSFRGGVAEIAVAAHYSCRTRNNRPGAKISEHGKGNAIDISGFRMKDGSRITVLHDWGRGKAGKVLREMHRRACGPFGVILGPEADKYHRDHFHFDTSRQSYCR